MMKKQNGFTLIETLVAATLLSVGATAYCGALLASNNALERSAFRTMLQQMLVNSSEVFHLNYMPSDQSLIPAIITRNSDTRQSKLLQRLRENLSRQSTPDSISQFQIVRSDHQNPGFQLCVEYNIGSGTSVSGDHTELMCTEADTGAYLR